MNMEPPWRFGFRCFSFSFGCFWSSMLIFPGVVLNHLLFWSNKLDSGLRLSLPDQNLSIHQTGSNKEWGSISFLESPEAIRVLRVLSAKTSLKDSKPIQTLVIFLVASICKSVHKNLMISEFILFNSLQLLYEQFTWFTLTVVRNSKIMTMQHSVTAGMDFPCPSLTYWCFEIGTSAQQHQSEKSESVCTAILKQVTKETWLPLHLTLHAV